MNIITVGMVEGVVKGCTCGIDGAQFTSRLKWHLTGGILL